MKKRLGKVIGEVMDKKQFIPDSWTEQERMDWEEKMSETVKFKILTDEEVKSIKDNSKRGII